jgi:hypothetical protein
MRRRKPQRKTGIVEQGDMVNMVSDLAEFEDFRKQFLPMIQKDLREGKTVKELREKYQAMLQARVIQIGLMEQDASKALAAIKDSLDRTEGRAVERKAIAHKFESMDDRELDALLASKLKQAGRLESGNSDD